VRPLALDVIVVRPEIQVRLEGLNEDQVTAWAEALESGKEFPPIVVFRDIDESGQEIYILADGFHRLESHRRAGLDVIKAEIHPGGYAGAFEYAETANLKHGQRLSTESLKAVLFRRLDRGHEWIGLSDRAVAEQLGVTHPTVGRWKAEYFGSTGKHLPVSEDTRTKNGQNMQVSAIKMANKKRSKKGPAPSKVKRKILSDLRNISDALDRIDECTYASQVDEFVDILRGKWGEK
jgi:transposase